MDKAKLLLRKLWASTVAPWPTYIASFLITKVLDTQLKIMAAHIVPYTYWQLVLVIAAINVLVIALLVLFVISCKMSWDAWYATNADTQIGNSNRIARLQRWRKKYVRKVH